VIEGENASQRLGDDDRSVRAFTVNRPFASQEDSPIEDNFARDGTSSDTSTRSRSTVRRCKVKGLKELKKVWPAVMVKQFLDNYKGTPTPRLRHAVLHREDSDEDMPLQPGETRIRNSIRIRGRERAVTGDSESSCESTQDTFIGRSPWQSGEDTRHSHPNSLSPLSRQKHRSEHASSLNHSASEPDASGSESSVDDDEINAWLRDETPSHEAGWVGRLPKEDLIDWMLCRTRTVTTNAEGKRRKHSSILKGSKEALVMTAARKSRSGRNLSHLKYTNSRKSRDTNNTYRHTSTVSMGETSAGHGRRVSESRRKRNHPNDGSRLHVFVRTGSRVISGRRGDITFTVDLEDEEFHRALAPAFTDGSTSHASLPLRAVSPSSVINMPSQTLDFCVRTGAEEYSKFQHHGRYLEILMDFDISFLPSGITFEPDTYIGRGWLRELIAAISDEPEVDTPIAYSAHGLHLSTGMSLSDFLITLDLACEGLLNFAVASLEDKAEYTKHWEEVTHIICQFVSWLPGQLPSENFLPFKAAVNERLLRLKTNLGGHEHSSEDINLMIHWFVVEMSSRLWRSLLGSIDNSVSDADIFVKEVIQMIRHLMDYGLQRTMLFVRQPHSDTSQRLTAEMWIRLLHLLDNCGLTSQSDPVHPLWWILQRCVQSEGLLAHSGLEASESTWRTIFSLCALSQFSVHGMSTSICRIGASWDMVVFALRKIRLTTEFDDKQSLPGRSLAKRDDYVRLTTFRCFILADRWSWTFDHAVDMFNELAEIFRSRSFANLRGEISDFPAFMLHHDWELLLSSRPSDTAFELFLKLIVRAASIPSESDDLEYRPLSPRSKKLLSLAIPVGSVSFANLMQPTIQELSMLYNRFGAIAVAIYLDPTSANVHLRVTHARRYINFKDADENLRIACIRGAMYFAVLLCHRRIPLDEVLDWFSDMTLILVNDCTVGAGGNDSGDKSTTNLIRNRALLCIQLLLGSVRHILEVCQTFPSQDAEYPKPVFINGCEYLGAVC
jgi:hypothetical protein